MKRLYHCLLMLVFFVQHISGQTDSASVAALGLPVLSVRTVNGEMPTCDFVWAPEGEFGIGTTNKTKVPGRVILTHGGSTLYDSGEYGKNTSGMTIRIRGNTSAYYSLKKPYKIKLEVKADMLARGDEKYNDKNWVLLDQGGDNLNAAVGFKLNELLQLGGWTPAYRYVNLLFNGNYHGVYMLAESVKRNTKARLNVDADGYIIERDAYWWNEPVYVSSSEGKKFTFKYPDQDVGTTEQKEFVKQFIDLMEKAIDDGTYDQSIDVQSFATWLLANDILGVGDAAGTNMFLLKRNASAKLEMATLWDFDADYRTPDQWSEIHLNDRLFYFPALLNSPNRSFSARYRPLWQEQGRSVIDQLCTFLTEFRQSDVAEGLRQSRPLDGATWNYPPDKVDDNIDNTLNWLTNRKQWLDTQIEAIDTITSGIAVIRPEQYSEQHSAKYSEQHPNQLFTLSGQRVTTKNPTPGIYIRNGKKYIIF